MTSESDPLDGGPGDLGNPAANPYASPTVISSDAGKISTRHPIAFWFFFWGEFSERCSFYGMKAILALYLIDVVGLQENTASSYQYRFKMACYILPLIGGFLADRFFGKYWTIVGFSIPYVLGHFVLGVPELPMVILGLCLLAGGSGVIKPNISTLMGQTYDRQRPGQDQLRVAAFMWFYVAINVGAFLSTLVMPQLRDDYGYQVAFQFPAWVMVASLIVFAAGRRYYTLEPIEHRPKTPEERAEQWTALGKLFPVFFLIVFFWIAYEQSDVHWIYFLKKSVDMRLPGFENPVSADKLQFINPLLVLTLVPAFNWVFKHFDPGGRHITGTRKMLAGFLLAAASSGIMSAAGYEAAATGEKVSVAWYIVAYCTLTVGEILLYGTALELAYSQAPKRMKSFVTACLLLTSAAADIFNDRFGKLYDDPWPPGKFFGVTALMVLGASVAFYFVGRRFDRQSQIVQAEAIE